jgi:DNA-binding NarL/FixJ family response regulator
MPVLDGFEATRRIRAIDSGAQILILTGTDEGFGSQDASAAGASGYLRKENSVTELNDVFLEVASLAAVLGDSSRQAEFRFRQVVGTGSLSGRETPKP